MGWDVMDYYNLGSPRPELARVLRDALAANNGPPRNMLTYHCHLSGFTAKLLAMEANNITGQHTLVRSSILA